MIISSPNYQPTPLTSWGGFHGRRRLSDSPFIENIWEGIASHDGTHLTAADGTIDLTFRKRQGTTRLLLSGPTSKVRATAFEAGDEILTIKLRTGTHFPFIAGNKLADIDGILPNAGSKRFWLHNTAVTFPTFDNAETFIGHMMKTGLLTHDTVVEDSLSEQPLEVSVRTVQRRFIATTGLTMNHIRQIKRAEHARDLLSSGHTLTGIAYEAGYSNPAHMTHAFKYFFGRTPSAMRALYQ